MFPGDVDGAAFRWFCKFVYETSRTGGGRKVFFVDEIWKHCSPNKIPIELATISQEGRIEDIELITATQRPQKLNDSIRGMVSELVCFRLQDHLALNCVADLGANRDDVENLPLGKFISYNLGNEATLRGQVF